MSDLIDGLNTPTSALKKIRALEALAFGLEAELNSALVQLRVCLAEAAEVRTEAAIPRAYQMGLDAAANRAEHERDLRGAVRNTDGLWTAITAIRKLQPPADLVERAKGGE